MHLSIKQGTTLYLPCTDDTTDLTDVTITAAVRIGSTFYQALTVSDIDTSAGTYVLSADTDLWPIGSLECDIKYDGETYVSRSESFEIVVKSKVTK